MALQQQLRPTDEGRWFFSDFQRSLVLAELRRLREDVPGEGDSMVQVQSLLGHADANALLRYAHVQVDAMADLLPLLLSISRSLAGSRGLADANPTMEIIKP